MRKQKTCVVLLASVALLVTACGSSSAKVSGSSSSSTAATRGSVNSVVSGTPLKVGVPCSCTGVFGEFQAPAADVARAWANSVNASGGIDGHPIKLDVEDNGGVPGNAVTVVQKMISEHVAVILDLDLLDQAWTTVPPSAGVPVVGGNFAVQPYSTNSDYYPSGTTDDSVGYAVVTLAKAAGATNIGNIYCTESPDCALTVPAVRAAGKKLGISEVYRAAISATAASFTAQCVAAEQAHVSSLLLGDSPTVLTRFAQDCSQQGYKPIYLLAGTGVSLQLASAPGLNQDMWAIYPDLPFWDSAAPVQEMNAAVDKYYPGIRNTATWTEDAALSWTGGLLIEDAIKASGIGPSGAVNAAGVLKGLNSIKDDTLGGWSPPLTFKAGAPHPVDCWFTTHFQNGTGTVTNGGKPTCENL
jgi:branched-chain amino acid transport system substrate-binding protein